MGEPDAAIRGFFGGLGRSRRRRRAASGSDAVVVPLSYRVLRPMRPESPRPWTMGTRGTLRDASTPTACRLGAERSLVRIQSPRLTRARSTSGLSRTRSTPETACRMPVVSAVGPDGLHAARVSLAQDAVPAGGARGTPAFVLTRELAGPMTHLQRGPSPSPRVEGLTVLARLRDRRPLAAPDPDERPSRGLVTRQRAARAR